MTSLSILIASLDCEPHDMYLIHPCLNGNPSPQAKTDRVVQAAAQGDTEQENASIAPAPRHISY